MQWLDADTLDWLESLMTDPAVRSVLVIGAYRDNEVGPAHPLMRTLATSREAGALIQHIVLAPLRLEHLERLVADALRCGRESARPLAQLLLEKTGGNPFFFIQLLSALEDDGLLRFDRDASGWTWDVGRIRAKGYSENAVDLMVGKLRRLPDTTQTALQRLAYLGNVADIATLIGGTLLAHMTAAGLDAQLFDVANHLNRGAELLIDHGERVVVAGINLSAGRKARASAAYASARNYLCAGMELLDGHDWTLQYELTYALHLERAESELLNGTAFNMSK